MHIYNIAGSNYDNIVLRRVVRRGENLYQSYQIYRKGKRVVGSASILWTVRENGTGLTITDCRTDTEDTIIIPVELEYNYVTEIEALAFDNMNNNNVQILIDSLHEVELKLSVTNDIDIKVIKEEL